MANLSCTSCGAALEIANQFVRTVTCRYCGASYLVSGSDKLDPTGKSASLADYPSKLYPGVRGKLRGRGFKVLGRVRYAYPSGFWEEWQIAWDDDAPPDWLEEDEGYWTLFKRERVRGTLPAFEEIRVGGSYTVNNRQLFVTEKRTARLAGSEGQFSAVLPLQGNFGYVQGSVGDNAASVIFWEDEIEVEIGEDLEHGELVFDK